MTSLENAVVLVTGGGRGLGRALVDEVLARGAAKVYATARDPRSVTSPDVVPLALEVTDPASVAAAAEQAKDVTVLVNNAGVSVQASFLTSPVEDIRREFETNFYGPLQVTRAFVPIIEANGGGHVLNVHSVLSWIGVAGSYSASKAALWSQTNSLRLELKPRGIRCDGSARRVRRHRHGGGRRRAQVQPEGCRRARHRRSRVRSVRGARRRPVAARQGGPGRGHRDPVPATREVTRAGRRAPGGVADASATAADVPSSFADPTAGPFSASSAAR
ncbi:Short chain dehydrogenase [Streptomyces hygroscopicus subsp. limoneus]|nr:Short chain dehydrogenase [Streptomyces hygroscopicus subsp. limoneus]